MILGIYYCFNIVIIVIAVILSTIVVNVSEGYNCDLPRCLIRVRLPSIAQTHNYPIIYRQSKRMKAFFRSTKD